jgi:hypothetical protein
MKLPMRGLIDGRGFRAHLKGSRLTTACQPFDYRKEVDFKAFTDQLLAANVTAQDIADVLGVSRNTVLRARMEGPNSRPAPPDWEPKLKGLAKERAAELERLAKARAP